jgi:hypothetical protein
VNSKGAVSFTFGAKDNEMAGFQNPAIPLSTI